MSRRTRSRQRPARRAAVPRWLLVLASALAVLTAGWWFFVRDAGPAVGGQTGVPLAAYRPPDIHALAVHPADAQTVIFGSHRGMLVSRDRGATWSPVGPTGDAMGIAVPPGSRTAYAAGHDVFFRSDDGGRTWSSTRPALPGTDIHGLAASATRPSTFYAYVVGQGLYRSDDAGQSWQRGGGAPGSTMSLAAASGGGADVLFASTMEGVQRSRDGGATWERVPELAGAYVNAAGSVVYAAAGNAVFVSSDGGASWERRAFPRGELALIAPAPSDPKHVYVVTIRFEVWRSSDGGVSWERAG